MPINLGSTEVDAIRLGSTEVDKVYLGSTEVYSSAPAELVAPVISLVSFSFNAENGEMEGVFRMTRPARTVSHYDTRSRPIDDSLDWFELGAEALDASQLVTVGGVQLYELSFVFVLITEEIAAGGVRLEARYLSTQPVELSPWSNALTLSTITS